MAFESLRSTVSREISADRDQKRRLNDPEFLQRVQLLKEQTQGQGIQNEINLENLRVAKARQDALNKFNELRINLASTPIEAFDVPEHMQAQIEEARQTGDPGLIEDTENRVKFLITAKTDPDAIAPLLGTIDTGEGTGVLGDPTKSETSDLAKTLRTSQDKRTTQELDLLEGFDGVTPEDIESVKAGKGLPVDAVGRLKPKPKSPGVVVNTGDKILSGIAKKAADDFLKLQKIPGIIDNVEKLFLNLNPGSGLFGKLDAFANSLASEFGLNPKFKGFKSVVPRIAVQVARALGDVGNIAVIEQKLIAELLPNETDTREDGLEKIKNFRFLMNGILDNNVEIMKSVLQDIGVPESEFFKNPRIFTQQERVNQMLSDPDGDLNANSGSANFIAPESISTQIDSVNSEFQEKKSQWLQEFDSQLGGGLK